MWMRTIWWTGQSGQCRRLEVRLMWMAAVATGQCWLCMLARLWVEGSCNCRGCHRSGGRWAAGAAQTASSRQQRRYAEVSGSRQLQEWMIGHSFCGPTANVVRLEGFLNVVSHHNMPIGTTHLIRIIIFFPGFVSSITLMPTTIFIKQLKRNSLGIYNDKFNSHKTSSVFFLYFYSSLQHQHLFVSFLHCF